MSAEPKFPSKNNSYSFLPFFFYIFGRVLLMSLSYTKRASGANQNLNPGIFDEFAYIHTSNMIDIILIVLKIRTQKLNIDQRTMKIQSRPY